MPITQPAIARPDARIAPSGGVYLGAGVYNLTGSNQTALVQVSPGQTYAFGIKIQNSGNQADTLQLKGKCNNPSFAVRYFKGATGTTDITADVTGGNYFTASLAPGAITSKAEMIRMEVTVPPGLGGPIAVKVLLKAFSTADGSKIDVVKAKLVLP